MGKKNGNQWLFFNKKGLLQKLFAAAP